MKMKKIKYGKLGVSLLIITLLLLGVSFSIPDAQALTVYQSFHSQGLLDDGWSSYTDVYQSTFSNSWIFYNYEPYHLAYPSISPNGGYHSAPSGYLRKTFSSTNSTNFSWLNITAYYFVENIHTNAPNIMINLNDRVLFGDCYPSANMSFQNNQFAVTVSKTGSVYSNFEDPVAYGSGQVGFNILHYTGDWNILMNTIGDWHKLSLIVAQTNTSYTLSYYYDDNLVLTPITWALAYFTAPLEVYDIKLYLGAETWIDDIYMDYRYETTPISTPYYDLWHLSYAFVPSDNPLIVNKSYTLNLYSRLGAYAIQSTLNLEIEGSNLGNFTTDEGGVASMPMSFPTVGTYDIIIKAYYNDALVKTLTSYFTVSTYPTTAPPTWIDWTIDTLLDILVPGIVVGIVAFGVSGLFDRFDHGEAGFFIGASMGLVIVTNSGLVPMWFFMLTFIIGAVSVLYYVRS